MFRNQENKSSRGLLVFLAIVIGIASLGLFKYRDYLSLGVSESRVKELVAEYINDNPQHIMDSVMKHREKEYLKSLDESKKDITSEKALLNQGSYPVLGNKNSDKVIYYFFDYNCSYCKAATANVISLIAQASDVKVVLRDYPILGENSESIARFALAFNKVNPDKFPFFFKQLSVTNILNDEELKRITSSLGVNYDNVKSHVNDKDISDTLNSTKTFAGKVGMKGTPSFIINDELNVGVIQPEEMLNKLGGSKNNK